MKLGKIISARTALLNHQNEQIDIKTAYKIFRFCKEIEREALGFYNAKFNEILSKYAHKTGNGYKVKEDKRAAFSAELHDLDELEATAPEISFTLDELACMKMSVADIRALSDFIEEV